MKIREIFAVIVSVVLSISVGFLVKWNWDDLLNASQVIAYFLIFGIIAVITWGFKTRIEGFFDRIENKGKLQKKIKHDADLKLVFQKFTTLMYKEQDNFHYALFVFANPTPIDEMVGKFNTIVEFFDSEDWKIQLQHVPDQVENFDMFDSHMKYEKYRAIRGHLITLSEAQIFNYNNIRNDARGLIKNHLQNSTITTFENNDSSKEQNIPYNIDRLSNDLLSFIIKNWEKRNELDFKSLKKKENYEDIKQLGIDGERLEIDVDKYYDGIIVDCQNNEVNLEKLRNIIISISRDSDVLQHCEYVMNEGKELHENVLSLRKEIEKILKDEDVIKGECKICNSKIFSGTHSK